MDFAILARFTSYSQKITREKVSYFRFFHHSESELCRQCATQWRCNGQMLRRKTLRICPTRHPLPRRTSPWRNKKIYSPRIVLYFAEYKHINTPNQLTTFDGRIQVNSCQIIW